MKRSTLKKKPKSKQRLKKELDRLVQEIGVALHPVCLVCDNRTSEMHHYIQKNQSLYLRWDFRNLIPLCKKCHCLHHIAGDSRIHQMILKRKRFAWADELERDRRIIFKDTIGNLEEVRERLQKYAGRE